jgi:hypothetical protein
LATIVEKLDGWWQFYQGDDKRWRWRCTTSAPQKVVDSEQTFERFSDVLVDAAQHGFVMSSRRSRL